MRAPRPGYALRLPEEPPDGGEHASGPAREVEDAEVLRDLLDAVVGDVEDEHEAVVLEAWAREVCNGGGLDRRSRAAARGLCELARRRRLRGPLERQHALEVLAANARVASAASAADAAERVAALRSRSAEPNALTFYALSARAWEIGDDAAARLAVSDAVASGLWPTLTMRCSGPKAWRLDVHGLGPFDACAAVAWWLVDGLRASPPPETAALEVLTGRGAHSRVPGRSPVRACVREVLDHNAVPYRAGGSNADAGLVLLPGCGDPLAALPVELSVPPAHVRSA